jgi:phosphoribosylaminoimidazole carboxylase PurE protein
MNPVIGTMVGSDSDLPVVEETAKVLEEFGVPYEVTIASAHRSPEKARQWVTGAPVRGLKVVTAAAGMAAHLPGVLAAHTSLPVIGLPVASGPLGGLDALYSMTQMPPGIPVATVGIGSPRNAGLLALRILAVSDECLRQRLEECAGKMATGVQEKDDILREKGLWGYRKEGTR